MKLMKSVLSVVLGSAVALSGIGSLFASASYPDSVDWSLYKQQYVSHLIDDKTIVAYGNGYRASITSKSGNCAYNVIQLTSGAFNGTKYISEVNMPVEIYPVDLDGPSVSIHIVLSALNGTTAYNGGTISIRN